MEKLATVLAVAAGLALTLPASGQMGGMGMGGPGMMMGPSDSGMAAPRHGYVMANGIGARYAAARNPLAASAANVKSGKDIFERICAACHGPTGRGDGPSAQGLEPPPADLATALRMPMASDAYLDWTIAEGGAALHSAMPAYKEILSGDQIWQLVLYLRTL